MPTEPPYYHATDLFRCARPNPASLFLVQDNQTEGVLPQQTYTSAVHYHSQFQPSTDSSECIAPPIIVSSSLIKTARYPLLQSLFDDISPFNHLTRTFTSFTQANFLCRYFLPVGNLLLSFVLNSCNLLHQLCYNTREWLHSCTLLVASTSSTRCAISALSIPRSLNAASLARARSTDSGSSFRSIVSMSTSIPTLLYCAVSDTTDRTIGS